MVTNPAFRGGGRSQHFLAFVVEKACDGQFELLAERGLGVEVFGRDPSFDTGLDSTGRVAASDVRNRLLRYYADPGQESAMRIERPAGFYIPEFRMGARDTFTDQVFARTLTAQMREAAGHIPLYFQVLLMVSYKG